MQDLQVPVPYAVAGIRNFGWVVPGGLARGEQPPLIDSTFRGLRDLGIGGVLSLRPNGEQPSPHRRISSPFAYDVEEERLVVERAGLRFAHAPLEDFSAPPPDALAAALATLDEQIARSQCVYVHCRAGAGRAGLVTGAWLVAHGSTGNQAVAQYRAFMDHLGAAVQLSAADWQATLVRIGQPQVLWALREVATALGSPVTQDVGLLPAARAADADGWEQGYRETLSAWRIRRP
jgi:protein tyrosine phosphatase (PTP) superfamily phosphohydrolase (DUF442 family)